MNCLICNKKTLQFLDFKKIPLVNSFSKKQLMSNKKFPLKVMICNNCFVCQLSNTPDEKKIFDKYAHYSSASKDNVEHLKKLAKLLKKEYPKKKHVLEVGSNDGTFLRFLKSEKFKVEGVDPAKNFKTIHKKNNLKIYYQHFGANFLNVNNFLKFDLVVGINVFAHFKNILAAFKTVNLILKPDGEFIFEVAYALPTLFSGNFDTIYHEHVFNHTITGLRNILALSNFEIKKIEKINTQGGSLRVRAIKRNHIKKFIGQNLLVAEINKGFNKINFYKNFSNTLKKKIKKINKELKKFDKSKKKNILLVGAPARGVIFSNATNILKLRKVNLYCVDDTDAKVNKFFPGLNIKVQNWQYVRLNIKKFDRAILLSWNYKKTMTQKLKKVKFKGKLLTFFPRISYSFF